MRKHVRLIEKAGMAALGLAAMCMVSGAPGASAQMQTEIHGAPPGAIGIGGGGAFHAGGPAEESGFNEVIVDDGRPGHVASGGYVPLPPPGPACTVEIVGRGGRGVAQNDDPGCGVAGAYGPLQVSGGIATYP